MHKFETFLLFLVASLLCGCTSIETKVEMTKGRFKIPEIENFNGVGKFVPEQTLLKGFSFSVAKSKDREIPMDVSNEKEDFSDSITLPNSKIDFAYVHKTWISQACWISSTRTTSSYRDYPSASIRHYPHLYGALLV